MIPTIREWGILGRTPKYMLDLNEGGKHRGRKGRREGKEGERKGGREGGRKQEKEGRRREEKSEIER